MTAETAESPTRPDTAIASADLGAQGRKSLVLDTDGWYVVAHHRGPDDDRIVIKTPYRDAAETVYAAFDGPRPWHDAYLPRGFNERDPAKIVNAYAVGSGTTPEAAAIAAVTAFLDSLGTELDPGSLEPMDDEDRDYQWGYRFRDRQSGTGFKAAGRFIPGGAILTWWK